MRLATCCFMAVLAMSIVAAMRAESSQRTQERPDISAYRLIYDSSAPVPEKIELAEAFLADNRPEFLASPYRRDVFLLLVKSYQRERNWPKAVATIDRLEKIVPGTPDKQRISFFEEGLSIASKELMDRDKAIEYAKKIVAIDPSNEAARQLLER